MIAPERITSRLSRLRWFWRAFSTAAANRTGSTPFSSGGALFHSWVGHSTPVRFALARGAAGGTALGGTAEQAARQIDKAKISQERTVDLICTLP
jgi:hypothetical protein